MIYAKSEDNAQVCDKMGNIIHVMDDSQITRVTRNNTGRKFTTNYMKKLFSISVYTVQGVNLSFNQFCFLLTMKFGFIQ